MTKLTEIENGLQMRILKESKLRRKDDGAEVGQRPVMHYTGWLYDEDAEDNRGEKFDSSLDRGKYFHFRLGANKVIQGWEKGVLGMKIGEVRELTIAPRLGYGKQGTDNIPPGSKLVFEIELFAFVDK